MKRTKNALKIIAILPAIFFFLSCDLQLGDDEMSGSVLVFQRIVGTDAEGNEVDYLESDVEVLGVVYADTAAAYLEATSKNPEPLVPGASYKNSIMIDRYTVTYMLTPEGGGTEGVDVPLAFEGSLSTVCEIDSSTAISFIIVRAAAKLASPLVELTAGGILQLVARVDFFGHDLAGNPVQATGYLTIYFANYVDA